MFSLISSSRHPTAGVLSDGLLQEVLGRLDLLLVPRDRDDSLAGPRGRLVYGDRRFGVISDLPDPLSAWSYDGPRQVVRNGDLGVLLLPSVSFPQVASIEFKSSILRSSKPTREASTTSSPKSRCSRVSSPSAPVKTSKAVITEALIVSSPAPASSYKSPPTSESASTEAKPSVHVRAESRAVSRSTKPSVRERSTPEASTSSRRSAEISSTSRRSSSHSSSAAASACKAGLPSVAAILVGEESIEVCRVVVVVVALDLGVGHHVEDEVEGGHETLQSSTDLDTAVAGLRGAVRENLAERES